MVQKHSWQGWILLQRGFRHLYSHPHRAASRCRWLLPTPEEIFHDAQIHAWPLLGQIWMVYESWWWRLHQRGQARELPQEFEQQRAPFSRADWPRHHGGDGKAGARTGWELLHGGTRSDHEPGSPAENGAPHWRVPARDVHHPRGRGSGKMRTEVCGSAVCMVLWGKDGGIEDNMCVLGDIRRGWERLAAGGCCRVSVQRFLQSSTPCSTRPSSCTISTLFDSCKRHPGIDLHKYRSATVRREMNPDIRHIGARGGTFIIHKRYFYLDRKGITLNQNGHGSLQSWLSKPLLSSLAGYVMVSVWKIDDTIPVRLTAVEMRKADRCLPWQWQFFPQPAAMPEISHGGWHCHPACWAASRPAHSPGPSCRRLLSRSLTSAEKSHRSYTETRGLPTLVWLWNLASWGGKKWASPACLWQSFLLLFLLGAGDSSQGWRGFCFGCTGCFEASPGCFQTVWLKTPARLELQFLLPCQGKCWWVCPWNEGEVESRREGEQFVFLHKHLWLVRDYRFVLLWDVVKGEILRVWEKSRGYR